MIIKKTYTVWYWDNPYKRYRVGRTFKSKRSADAFIKTLYNWQHIGTTIKYFILDDDVA